MSLKALILAGIFCFNSIFGERRFHYGYNSTVADEFFAPIMRKPWLTWSSLEYVCGGVWISMYFALTSGYCVVYHDDINRVGYLKFNHTEWQMHDEQAFVIERTFYYNDYNYKGDKRFENDIGLVRISKEARRRHNPVGYFPEIYNNWSADLTDLASRPQVMFGFGRTETGGYARKLKFMKGRVRFLGSGLECHVPACSQEMAFRFVPDEQGDRIDNGDMGNPVYYDIYHPDQMGTQARVILGIVSNYKYNPSYIILTNVTRHKGWIENILKTFS